MGEYYLKIRIILPFAEAIVITIIVACLFLSKWLEYLGAGEVAWIDFTSAYVYATGLMAFGLGYRLSGRSEKIAAVLMVTGLYVAFSNAGATLNYLLHPAGACSMDGFLFWADSFLGFNWLEFVTYFNDREMLSRFLQAIYDSSLLQLLIVILFLGFTGRIHRLHEFMLVGVTASLLSIMIWSVMPSFGPALLEHFEPNLNENLPVFIDADYVAHLRGVANGETGVISPSSLRGLIAFPSMHTVMALMAVFFTTGTRASPCVLLVNIPMGPAILLHGGHHLVDIIGGFLVFIFVLWFVRIFTDKFRFAAGPSASTPSKASLEPPKRKTLSTRIRR